MSDLQIQNSVEPYFYFGAGPAALPSIVKQQAKEAIDEFADSHISILEIGHRTPQFLLVYEELVARLRRVLEIPDNYKLLFMQGGANLQFSAVPLNLITPNERAGYVLTGIWSNKAYAEGERMADVYISASSEPTGFDHMPNPEHWKIMDRTSYLHVTTNETIHGIALHQDPTNIDVPLVADMTSEILSRPINWSTYGLIYAGAQKNLGIPGMTLVIVREDLLSHAVDKTPKLLDYAVQAEGDSMVNTPVLFAWYVGLLMLRWYESQGTVHEFFKRNRIRACRMYEFIDNSDLYSNPVNTRDRSYMNIPFRLQDAKLDQEFLKQAAHQKLYGLKGHRDFGGMRASIYNAMPDQGVGQLLDFMREFETEKG